MLAAYLGGILTILSLCILPVLPFVFARSDQPFTRSGLPILLGMGGNGVVRAQRLHQLVHFAGDVTDHTIEIRFLDPGVSAYSFTFG